MCHKCGYKNKSGSNFCNECDNNLQIQIADKFLEFQSPQYNFKINYPAKWQKRDKLPEGITKVIFSSQSENLTNLYKSLTSYTGDSILPSKDVTLMKMMKIFTNK